MSDYELKGITIDESKSYNTSDADSSFSRGFINTALNATTENFDLNSSPEMNYDNAYSTMHLFYEFEHKIMSSDKWNPVFSSNNNAVFKKYVEQYKNKTGIDLYDLSSYSFGELVEKGVFQSNGDFIPDRDLVMQVMHDGKFNSYIDSGYGVDVFCSWVRDNASISFDKNTTIMNTKLSDVSNHTNYVKSDDENNVLASGESDSIIQTTNSIAEFLHVDGYDAVFNEYIKTKPISELVDSNGKMHIDENDLRQFVIKYNSEHPKNKFFGDDYSVTKQVHSLTLIVNNLDIKYDPIKEDRHINGTFGDLYNEEKAFSNASDLDQINLNRFNNDLTNGAKERFGRDSNKYKVYCKFLEGKKLNDIIKNGHFVASKEDLIAAAKEAGVTLTNEEITDIIYYFSSTTVSQYSDSATLRNLTITKVISDEYGYDSIIFEKDGEVIITNTCADGESSEDNAAIGYSAIKLLCGNNSELYDLLGPAFSGTTGQISGFMSYGDISKAKDYYNGQIAHSYENVLSQLKAGKKVHINCYSLGGGTGFDTFMRIMADDKIPEEYKANLTCSGFNPYFNMFEADPFFGDREGHEAAVKKVFGKYGDHIDLRCVEGDAVSQFNTVVDGELGKYITYIKAPEGTALTMSDFGDGTIMDLIVNPGSRHSTANIDLDTFNNGYIIDEGKRITMNEILGNDEPSNDLKVIYKGLVTPYLNSLKEGDNAPYAGVIDAIDKYLQEHVGEDISYDGLIDSLSAPMSDLVESMVPDILSEMLDSEDLGGIAGDIANDINDNEIFSKKINEYFKSDEGKKKIKSVLKLIGNKKNSMDDIKGELQPVIQDLYIESLKESGIDKAKTAGEVVLVGIVSMTSPLGGALLGILFWG